MGQFCLLVELYREGSAPADSIKKSENFLSRSTLYIPKFEEEKKLSFLISTSKERRKSESVNILFVSRIVKV